MQITQERLHRALLKPSWLGLPNTLLPNAAEEAIARIEAFFAQEGLTLRRARPEEAEEIVAFRNSRFDSPNRYTPYWMFHLTSFGNSVVVRNPAGALVGCFLEASYADAAHTSYHVLVAVADSLAGKRIAARLSQYVCLKALLAGAWVAQGTISPDNFGSMASFINHSGAVFTDFQEDFCGFGPRFVFKIPLSLQGILGQSLYLPQLQAWQHGKAAPDVPHRWVDATDLAAIRRLYAETPYRCVALLKGTDTLPPYFFAIPLATL